MSPGRRTAPALLLALALAASLAPASSAARPWTEVAAGGRGEYRWSVSLGERHGAPGARSAAAGQPCLLVASSWRSGPLEWHRSSYRECASAPLRGAEAPLVATSMQTSGSARISAVGIAFSGGVRAAQITLAGGRRLAIHPRRTASGSALGYAAFTIGGQWCAERIVTLGARGSVLWDSGGADQYECGSASQPPQFAPRSPTALDPP